MVFPVVIYGCESWTIKKAEHWRMMLLNCGVGEDSWESLEPQRRPNQSNLKEISPGYSLEGLMLKLKLQYFGHLMWRTDSFERPWHWERLKVGGNGDDRVWDGWMASPTQWTWVWVNSRSWWWTGRPGMLQSMGVQRVRHSWATELTEYKQGNGETNFFKERTISVMLESGAIVMFWGHKWCHPSQFPYEVPPPSSNEVSEAEWRA